MSATSIALAVVGLTAGLVLTWRLPTPPRARPTGRVASVSVVIPARN
jgi:hypothetical protein